MSPDPGKIKSREMELDPQESPGNIKRKEVELDPREPSRDPEQGGGAGLSKRGGQSFASVVPQQLLLGHCLCGFLLKQQLAKYTSDSALAGSPAPP